MVWRLVLGEGGRGGGQEGALLVLCDLNDGVIGPELRGAVTSLQDTRQVVG